MCQYCFSAFWQWFPIIWCRFQVYLTQNQRAFKGQTKSQNMLSQINSLITYGFQQVSDISKNVWQYYYIRRWHIRVLETKFVRLNEPYCHLGYCILGMDPSPSIYITLKGNEPTWCLHIHKHRMWAFPTQNGLDGLWMYFAHRLTLGYSMAVWTVKIC